MSFWQEWRQLAEQHRSSQGNVVVVVIGEGMYRLDGDRVVRVVKWSRKMVSHIIPLDKRELRDFEHAVAQGWALIEWHPNHGLVGGQGGTVTGYELAFPRRVLRRATGRPETSEEVSSAVTPREG